MGKWLKIVLSMVFMLIVLGVGTYLIFFREGAEELEPKVVTFPFSWEEDEEGYLTNITGKPGVVRITVVNITALGKTLKKVGSYLEAEEGYQFYGVYAIGKNLLHEEWWTGGAHGHVGTNFELKTNRGNLYKPKSGWGDIRFGFGSPMRPEEQVDGWVIFEIREDEEPVELRHYEVMNPGASWEEQELGIVYIWRIE